MKITVYCIGKLKEDYWKSAIAEYAKRIKAYSDLEIIEFPDLPTPASSSPAIEEDIKNKECVRIIAKLKPSEYLIALDLNKKEYDSPSFASHIDSCLEKAGANVSFVIGGSLGLSDDLKLRANESISFGKMTFPHQLARVMLLEQIYRAFKINRHEPYHK
ncbi:MAG: 23S rRNA (pseudouridine(1915)-N(3))-methyltransferase RlmH [Bacilli bacterium]|nr:23S rRNA (pseudouridine(1915)-N(3))-methyltransferase RlmH [Bacilli bacterium]